MALLGNKEIARSMFAESRHAGNSMCTLHIDDAHKICYITTVIMRGFKIETVDSGYFMFSDIEHCEMSEDSDVLSSVKRNGVGRAVVGGLLFGGAGAIVGAVTGDSKIIKKTMIKSISLCVQLNGGQVPVTCNLLPMPAKPKSFQHTTALTAGKEVVSAIEDIINSTRADNDVATVNLPEEQGIAVFSAPDEIRKYKALLDDGIISQEEFDAKKKQILGI